MNDLTAMHANYSDFKLIKTRSVAQVVLEIDISRAEQFVRDFGIPQPGKEIAVLLALLSRPHPEIGSVPMVAMEPSDGLKPSAARQMFDPNVQRFWPSSATKGPGNAMLPQPAKEVMPHNPEHHKQLGQDTTGATDPSASGQPAQDRQPVQVGPSHTGGGAPLSRPEHFLDADARGSGAHNNSVEDAAPQKDSTKSLRAKEVYRNKDEMAQAATRAVMLCKDAKFWEWAELRSSDEFSAAIWMRDKCWVKSRSEIASGEMAYKRFLALEQSYRESVGLAAEPRT